MNYSIFLVGLLLAASSSCQAESFDVHGVERSCYSISELDRAFSVGDQRFFAGWDDADFDAAVAWASACVSSGWQFAGPYRVQRLRMYQSRLHAEATRRQRNADYDAREAREADQRAQDALAAKIKAEERKRSEQLIAEKRSDLNACQKRDEYLLYYTEGMIVGDLENIQSAKDQRRQQSKYAAASGVRNLSEERRIGEFLVQSQESLQVDFQEYKRLGGKAKAVTAVKEGVNPCEGIEAEVHALESRP